MTERIRRFYLVATWMPLIVPLCCAAGFAVRGKGGYEGIGADIGLILVVSLYSTGIPFTIVALWVTYWLRAPARTEKEVRRLMWGAPLIVAAFALPCWMATLAIEGGFTTELPLGIVLIYLPYLLVIGYLYVLATAGARWILGRSDKWRHVRDQQYTSRS
ncbi:MAG: hypothetical protein ACR2NS_09075 [Gemmatimonadaceae bacterium]